MDRIWLVFTGMSAPVLEFTDEAQLPSSSRLKNPPGHRPSFWLSRLIDEVAPPAVLPGAALAAIDDALTDLGDIEIEW